MSEPTAELIVESDGERHDIRVAGNDRQTRLTEVLRHHGLPLNTRCGERGLCEGCLVELVEGRLIDRDSGKAIEARPAGEPLRACLYRADAGRVVLRIPERSRTAYEPRVLESFDIRVPFAHAPLGVEGDADGQGRRLGIAIDIGTTTVALVLVDLADGRVLTRAAGFNRQMDLGDDVLTRINLCMTDSAMLGKFHAAIAVDTLRPLITKALDEAGATWGEVVSIAAAGNTTMLHLLANVDPSPMGIAPFTPRFLEHRAVPAAELGISSNGDATAATHLLPSAAAYIGADLTAGVIATGLRFDPGPSLLIDVGTNGEIILKHGKEMLGCATAAGPAFEGVGLSHGIRAGKGAVSHITLQRDPFKAEFEVIGDGRAVGICGTAYIDFLAQGFAAGLLSPSGRFTAEPPAGAAKRVVTDDGYGKAFRVAEDLKITEADIARLLQAKAAIAAGILTLLHNAGLKPADVKHVYLAGGFGMSLDLPNAIAAGLLPGFTPEQVTLVGNTSLAGAYMALMDRGMVDELDAVRRDIRIIELNLDPTFEDTFLDMLAIGA